MYKNLKNLYMTTQINIEISVFYTYQSNAAIKIYSRDSRFHAINLSNTKSSYLQEKSDQRFDKHLLVLKNVTAKKGNIRR